MTTQVLLVQHGANRGGATLGLMQLALALRESGEFTPYLLFSGKGPMAEYAHQLKLPVLIQPVAALMHVAAGAFRPAMLARFLFELPSTMRHIASILREERIDLVYLNTTAPLGAAHTAKRHGVGIIWHLYEVMASDSYLGRLQIATIQQLSDIIVTASDYVALPFSGHPNVIRVYDGISLPEFEGAKAARDAVRRELGIAKDCPLVGLVAIVANIKGHFVLLDAVPSVLARFPEARFLIVGESSVPPGYAHTWRGRWRRWRGQEYDPLQKLQRLVRERGLEQVVRFTGWRDDVPAVMAALDVVVFPSIVPEGFGRPLIEAGAAARPVIASDLGPAREIIEDGVTGLLVPPGSPGHLAEAIVSLLADKKRAAAMGQAGRKRVQKYFSEEQYVASMLNVFRQVARH